MLRKRRLLGKKVEIVDLLPHLENSWFYAHLDV
jgi:hypothetical protein